MRVLVACEFSGIVRDAFAKRGHDAWSCDILPTEKPGNHIQDDVLKHLDDGWDLMIAHPPCTYISNAGAVRLYPKRGVIDPARYELGMAAVEFFMALFSADISRICIENPIPSTVFGLPKYSQTIQPYEHGDPFSKKTCLWLKGIPTLSPSNVLSVYTPWVNAGTKRADGSKRVKVGEKHGWAERSRTFPGIAEAMAKQWGGE